MTEPLVSIVIPTYFRNDSLQVAIESALDQSYDRVEVIVVDDSGEGHARSIAEEYDIRFVPLQENKGPMAARKRGIDEASGKYVHFLDDDDELYADCVSKKVNVADKCGQTGVVYAGFVLNGDREVLPDEEIKGDVLRHALEIALLPCLPSTMLVETCVLRSIDLEEIDRNGLSNEHGINIELARRTLFDFVDEALTARNFDTESFGSSLAALNEYKKTIDYYEALYDGFPDDVERKARAYVHLMEGQLYVNNSLWSWSAIISFWKATLLRPGFHLVYFGSFVSSLGGRPLYRLSLILYTHLFASSTQKGKNI